MKSKEHERDDPQMELFKVELRGIVNTSDEMVKLADTIDWANFDRRFAPMWKDKGRSAIDTRVMVSLP